MVVLGSCTGCERNSPTCSADTTSLQPATMLTLQSDHRIRGCHHFPVLSQSNTGRGPHPQPGKLHRPVHYPAGPGGRAQTSSSNAMLNWHCDCVTAGGTVPTSDIDQ
eukprot:scpid60527/ scgid4457/ 